MKKILCVIALVMIVFTATAKEKSVADKTYDSTVKFVAFVRGTSKKAVKAIQDTGALDELQKKMDEAKAEWEKTGKDEAKKKYLEAKAAFEKFLKDVESAEKEAE